MPSHAEVPLARFTIPELWREVLARGIVAQISGVTLWRWLSAVALQPWRHRSWIFPRDAQFAEKGGRVLDRLPAFQGRYQQMAKPFQWAFTRNDLADLLAKLKAKELGRAA